MPQLVSRARRISRSSLIALAVALLVYATAGAVKAQENTGPTRTRTTTTVPNTQTQTPGPTTQADRRGRILLPPGIFGKISWKIEYGFPSTDGGVTPNKALNCTAFRVTGSVQAGPPGTLGTPQNVGFFATDNEPSQVNGYYVCKYSLADTNSDFPHGKPITVYAFLGPFASAELNRALAQGGWFGPGSPKPPAGEQRVPVGSRAVTLTDAQPRATVDFEMVYRPLPSGPR